MEIQILITILKKKRKNRLTPIVENKSIALVLALKVGRVCKNCRRAFPLF